MGHSPMVMYLNYIPCKGAVYSLATLWAPSLCGGHARYHGYVGADLEGWVDHDLCAVCLLGGGGDHC